ncbi:MAG: hypothetical protein ACKVP7_21875 [Hyphomicrobiaceae bacterium]
MPASKRSLPQPDVSVKERLPTGTPVSDEAWVIIEVLSRSNTPADRAWRRRVYPNVPNCQHYAMIASRSLEVTVHDRSRRWRERSIRKLSGMLDLSTLGVTLPLGLIYRATPFAHV